MKSLVVVESPSKAKTINKYLGKDYQVLASYGHIRKLPTKNGSVDPESDFKITYEIDKASQKHVNVLAEAMKKCDKLILASDPDREGEAIAWHVAEVLKAKKALDNNTRVERVVFNAITKKTIEEAMKSPRAIDMDLVNAQQARVALDYLVGFTLSPVLWRKLPGSRSAGRVQSVALRLICERQAEIASFETKEFWTLDVLTKTANRENLTARLLMVDGKKLDKLAIGDEEYAKKLEKELKKENYRVEAVEKKEVKRNPFAPFTTSTLQQEASKKLGFSAKKTMSIAQKLYEGIDTGGGSHGLITYMRTDGVYTAPEAIADTRKLIENSYGKKYLPSRAIVYQNKIKNAQEAHEAIRPTDPFLTPEEIRKYLTNDEFRLYDLIWKRLVASQMASMILDQVSIDIKTSHHGLRATGSTIKFKGFQILYDETREEDGEEKESSLPVVRVGEELEFQKVITQQHFTEPPAKYSEAALVKKMEELGIGRPSTYANIIAVLQDRDYVRLEKKRFIAENRGIIVNAFLKTYFKKYVEYDYTAKLEDDLDLVSNGKKNWKKLLNEFWLPFKETTDETLKIQNREILEQLSEIMKPLIFARDVNGEINNRCPDCKNGNLNLVSGKFGVFLACSNYPECKHTEQLTPLGDGSKPKSNEEIGDISRDIGGNDGDAGNSNNIEGINNKFVDKLLGQEGADNIYLKKGPYGFYVQKGENGSKKQKPKRVAVPKNMDPMTVDMDRAKLLLSLPRLLGVHPDGGNVEANFGRFGDYVAWNGKFYSIGNNGDALSINLGEALEIIKAKSGSGKKNGGKRDGSDSKKGEGKMEKGKVRKRVKKITR